MDLLTSKFDVGPHPLLDLVRPELDEKGCVPVPAGPGLGIDLRAEVLEPYVVDQKVIAA